MVTERLLGIGSALLLALACSKGGERGVSASSSQKAASSAPTSSAQPSAGRQAALLLAEHRRAPADVTLEDLSASDPLVRRAAARALARIQDAHAVELLAKSLADEDAEVVAWSAFGLGAACRGREAVTTRALSTRAASLMLAEASDAGAPPRAAATALPLLEPLAAIADALGRCGGPDAERALSAWLGGPPALAERAALALGALAARTSRLADTSLVALLDAAGRRDAPVPVALQAFTRLTLLAEPVRARLLEVTRPLLATAGPARSFAVRALANAGPEAVPELRGALESPGPSVPERADAARSLGRLGAPGQAALGDALAKVLEDGSLTQKESLLSERFGLLTAALDALEPPLLRAAPALARLAELPVGDGVVLRRRTVALRCRAAALVAGSGSESPRLSACDPESGGRAGSLALLTVLARGELKGARLRRFKELAGSPDAILRQRALGLLKAHAEVTEAPTLLATALLSRSPGDAATAGEIIESFPERASRERNARSPDPAVVRALGTALDAWQSAPTIEVRAALIGAAGALELLSAKPRLEADCKGENPTLREAAEKALRRLGDAAKRCDTFTPGAAPREALHLLTTRAVLDFDTDVGPLSLELDPALAPVAATRVLELARTGFYDNIRIHRVVPGFVVQLGDRGGDGYGGAPRPALRSEPSPADFTAGSVGIALGGKDSGSSQFFVTLGRHPHLDGEYALIGRASPGWERLAEGDGVRKVSVRGER